MHLGSDIGVGVGTTIYIKKPGTVIFAGNRDRSRPGWGNLVEIEHEDGSVTRYAHLSKINVNTNDAVSVGDLIGLTGGAKGAPGAGNSTGPHLHWEWLPDGNTAKNGASVIDDYFSLAKVTTKNDNIASTKTNKTKPDKTVTSATSKDTNTTKMHSILNTI